MGTEVAISIVTELESEATAIASHTFAEIAEAEAIFSRFQPESELSQLNRLKILTVSSIFIDVLKKAIDLHTMTNQAFNPLVQVARLGYQANFEQIKVQDQIADKSPYNLDVSLISLNETSRTVSLAEDQELDFGGILKGYLADKLAREIIKNNPSCHGVIINIGGDIHTEGYEANGDPFTFYLFNPISKTETPIALINTSLVSSGTYKRKWLTNEGPRHHIVAPDGISNPESDVVSASVIYEDGATAEAFAKYLLINGPDSIDQKLLPEDMLYSLTLKSGLTINHYL